MTKSAPVQGVGELPHLPFGGLVGSSSFDTRIVLPEDPEGPEGEFERGFYDRESTDQSAFSMKGPHLLYQGKRLDLLGAGSLGRVFAHPTRHEVVLKVPFHTEATMLASDITMDQSILADARATARLAIAGLGTYLLGCFEVDNHTVLLKERVYGNNLAELVAQGLLGPTEYGMVLGLVKKMSEERLRIEDMRLENFMIGTTLFDPTMRAYIVDGNDIEEVSSDVSSDDLYEAILHQHVIVSLRFQPYEMNNAFQPTMTQFIALLKEGLERSQETGLGSRFMRWVRDILSNMQLPPMK